MIKKIFSSIVVSAIALTALSSTVFAAYDLPEVDVGEPMTCGETTFTAFVGSNNPVTNMHLVVSADGTTQAEVIPTLPSTVEITVGPFITKDTEMMPIYYRIFGGGERDFDNPHWNGYGEPDFISDIVAYIGLFGDAWTIAGPEDPNPFVVWDEMEVETCGCKKGGWEALGFRNQGQCIRYVNTGMDSRD